MAKRGETHGVGDPPGAYRETPCPMSITDSVGHLAQQLPCEQPLHSPFLPVSAPAMYSPAHIRSAHQRKISTKLMCFSADAFSCGGSAGEMLSLSIQLLLPLPPASHHLLDATTSSTQGVINTHLLPYPVNA